MKTYLLMIAATALMLSCGDNNNPEDSTEAANESNEQKFDETEKDADFAVKAADNGLIEVRLADLALSKSSNNDVRPLAEMMKNDHSAANTELKGLASQKTISLPDSASSDKMDDYRKLAEKTGIEFDKAYADKMVKDHENAIDLFEKEANNGKDSDLRSWASSKLPTLREHLDRAKQVQEKLKDK